MRIIRSIGYFQIRIFGFITWIISIYLLFKLWGAIVLFVGFSPLAIIGPINHIFTNGLDTLGMIFLSSAGFSLLGFAIFALSNSILEQTEDVYSED